MKPSGPALEIYIKTGERSLIAALPAPGEVQGRAGRLKTMNREMPVRKTFIGTDWGKRPVKTSVVMPFHKAWLYLQGYVEPEERAYLDLLDGKIIRTPYSEFQKVAP